MKKFRKDYAGNEMESLASEAKCELLLKDRPLKENWLALFVQNSLRRISNDICRLPKSNVCMESSTFPKSMNVKFCTLLSITLFFPFLFLICNKQHLPHEFSSDPSPQSFSPLQKRPRSMQFPSPQARKPSWQSGSSVMSRGLIFRSLFLDLQFLTAPFQSQVCFSMSKNNPAGHRIAWRP